MLKILIIIVTYNGLKYIKDCLYNSFTTDDAINFMVIDNASSDETVQYIKENYSTIKIIKNEKNLGFGAANNIGLRYALDKNYDYVYLLNQDAWIKPESLKELIKIAEYNKDYGIISPLQVYPGEKKIDNNFSNNLPKELKDDYILNTVNKKEIYCVKRKTLQAAHSLIRVESLRIVGGFSPSFFHWGEDTNLCQRMEFHGFLLGIAPRINGIHNRENRKEPPIKNKILKYHSIVTTLSDPNYSRAQIIREIIKILATLCMYNPRWFFPLTFNFFCSLPILIKNRRKSIEKNSAFL